MSNYKQLNYSTAALNALLQDEASKKETILALKNSVQSLSNSVNVTTTEYLPADGVLKANTLYQLGELSKLNLSKGVPNSLKETVVTFSSSAAGCEIIIAASQKYIGSLATKPNTSYIMSIQNGIIVMAAVQ